MHRSANVSKNVQRVRSPLGTEIGVSLMPALVLLCLLSICGPLGCAAPAAEPERAHSPPPARLACPPGLHHSAGHCCLEGAEWVPSREECVCLEPAGCEQPTQPAELQPSETPEPSEVAPESPGEPDIADGRAEQEPCPAGRVRSNLTEGRCCWPEQRWAQENDRCAGPPTCPPGYLIDGDDCQRGEPPQWITVAAGEFLMGSPADEEHRFDDERQHQVRLTHQFRMMSTEVTQGEFERVMGYNPSRFSQCGDNCPVERVSWHEAAAFGNALSEQAGVEPCYRCTGTAPEVTCSPSDAFTPIQTCPGFRLPTEAEWEFALRAGTTASRYGDLDRIAWYRGNSGGRTHRAATREPNPWGFYDLFGNVMEWCHDWYSPFTGDAQTDPVGPANGSIRALRGGSWLINDWRVRAAYRYRFDPRTKVSYLGFRVAQSI